jgi:hypothetical protein
MIADHRGWLALVARGSELGGDTDPLARGVTGR